MVQSLLTILTDADAEIMADVRKNNNEKGQGDATGEMCSEKSPPHRCI